MSSTSVPILDALAQAAGLPTLALDAQGGCALAIGDLQVVLQHNPDDQSLTCFAELGTVPTARHADIVLAMLRANRFWRGTGGATLSLDESEPPVAVLAQHLDGRLPDAGATAVAALERFIDKAGDWAAYLAGDGEGQAQPPLMAELPPSAFFGRMA